MKLQKLIRKAKMRLPFWLVIIFVVCAFLIGAFVSYKSTSVLDYEQLKGFWTKIKADEHWVCVNVAMINDYGEMVSTCNHEVAHELFAEECEGKGRIGECIDAVLNLSGGV